MSKTIEEQMLLLKESFDAVGTKLNGITWQRIENSHLEFSQSKTQEIKEQNAEFVRLLEQLSKTKSVVGFLKIKYEAKEILTKHNHLNKKP